MDFHCLQQHRAELCSLQVDRPAGRVCTGLKPIHSCRKKEYLIVWFEKKEIYFSFFFLSVYLKVGSLFQVRTHGLSVYRLPTSTQLSTGAVDAYRGGSRVKTEARQLKNLALSLSLIAKAKIYQTKKHWQMSECVCVCVGCFFLNT